MIIDFHTHVLSPVDQDKYTTSKFHQTVLASCDFGRRHPATIENVLEAAKIGGVDISIISNPLHDMRDMDRSQQLKLSSDIIATWRTCKRSTIRSTPLPAPFPMEAIRSCASLNGR